MLSTVKKLYGLIGYPLSHSFSKKYFSDKFQKEGIEGSFYELFPISDIKALPDLVATHPNLVGLNVTIPYKEQVFEYLKEVHEEAATVGAVNTIKIVDGALYGYNSDVYGFETSLRTFLDQPNAKDLDAALILGTGGAAKAVAYVLDKMNLNYLRVSRSAKGDILYKDVNETILKKYRLIINTTPLGMAPNIDSCPNILYHYITEKHFLYDLVYNPDRTTFLAKGAAQGAAILNGLEMLHLQAEKSWEIWNAKSVQK